MIGTNLSTAERDRRWSALRAALLDANVDVLVVPNGADPNTVADIRYVTGFTQGLSALLVYRDRDPEAICGHACERWWIKRSGWGEAFYENDIAPVDLAMDRLAALGQNLAIGILDDSLSAPWMDALTAVYGPPKVIGNPMRSLRRTKSSEELALIRRSAALADEALQRGLTRLSVGVPEFMLRVEIEYAALSLGAEGSHGAYITYPQSPGESRAIAYLSERPLASGDVGMIELSPSARGYWSQLATHVAFGSPPEEYQRMYIASVEARQSALELLRPGHTLMEVVDRMTESVVSAGFVMNRSACGHGLGLTLAEPRVAQGVNHELRSGEAFTIHAIVGNSQKEEILRGDTYLITDNGPERLNKLPEELIILR